MLGSKTIHVGGAQVQGVNVINKDHDDMAERCGWLARRCPGRWRPRHSRWA
jgi:hypothetical protein